MFLGKEDLFLRKWEGQIVPQLLKVAAIENPSLIPDDEENDGEFSGSLQFNIFNNGVGFPFLFCVLLRVPFVHSPADPDTPPTSDSISQKRI